MSSEVVLKVGLIGLGRVSEAHLFAYKRSKEISVVAAVEPAADRLADMVLKFGFRGYADVRSMLEQERLDVACILTPVSKHRIVAEECAAAGVHVLCEKPMATTLDDAERMAAACVSNCVKFCYGASYRYLPAVKLAKDIILSGRLGKVMLMVETAIGGEGDANFKPMTFAHYPENGPGGSGMGLVDHGIHMIDLFPWLVDSRVSSVFGTGNVSGRPPTTEYASLTMANGAVGQLIYNHATFSTALPTEGIFSDGAAWNINGFDAQNTWHEQPGCIHIFGTAGALRVFHYANALFLRDGQGLTRIPVPRILPPAHFAEQMDTFARCIKEGRDPPVDASAGVEALRVLCGIYESSKSGASVKVAMP